MCRHLPPCPSATDHDRTAAHVAIAHAEQGWCLLCNGVVLFEDGGVLLPDGHVLSPADCCADVYAA